MTEKLDITEIQAEAPDAVIRPGRSFSIIWIVPLVAALIGGWLVYKAFSEKGSEISIVFESAEGLESDKTKIKYKDIEIGVVKSITLNKDLSGVMVTASLAREFAPFLTDKTSFWVVRPRISAGEISGLGTLMAGAYIAVDPSREGKPLLTFTGLERPPAVTADIPGNRFVLQADRAGSLDIGSPIYYRQLRVGEVERYELNPDGRSLTLNIFIRSPYDRFVFKNTRFWNAGGIDITVDAGGLKINTESLVSILLGGIAFETPVNLKASEPAKTGDVFVLHNSYQDAMKKIYALKSYWLIRFTGSVGGLALGAPVQFRGIQIGQVLDVDLKIDPDHPDFRIPVLIEIEAERIFQSNDILNDKAARKNFMTSLVANGLRAQLRSGNLLTGQLVVDLDFHSDAPPQEIAWTEPYPELPAIQAPLEEVFQTIAEAMKKINQLPLVEIGNDMRTAVKHLNQVLVQVNSTMESINTEVAPQAIMALDQATKTLASIEKTTAADSPLSLEARNAMREISDAARAVRVLVDYLERHPDALIYGKGKDQ